MTNYEPYGYGTTGIGYYTYVDTSTTASTDGTYSWSPAWPGSACRTQPVNDAGDALERLRGMRERRTRGLAIAS